MLLPKAPTSLTIETLPGSKFIPGELLSSIADKFAITGNYDDGTTCTILPEDVYIEGAVGQTQLVEGSNELTVYLYGYEDVYGTVTVTGEYTITLNIMYGEYGGADQETGYTLTKTKAMSTSSLRNFFMRMPGSEGPEEYDYLFDGDELHFEYGVFLGNMYAEGTPINWYPVEVGSSIWNSIFSTGSESQYLLRAYVTNGTDRSNYTIVPHLAGDTNGDFTVTCDYYPYYRNMTAEELACTTHLKQTVNGVTNKMIHGYMKVLGTGIYMYGNSMLVCITSNESAIGYVMFVVGGSSRSVNGDSEHVIACTATSDQISNEELTAGYETVFNKFSFDGTGTLNDNIGTNKDISNSKYVFLSYDRSQGQSPFGGICIPSDEFTAPYASTIGYVSSAAKLHALCTDGDGLKRTNTVTFTITT